MCQRECKIIFLHLLSHYKNNFVHLLMEILYLLIGLCIGVVVTFLIFHGKSAAGKALLESEQKARAEEKEIYAQQISGLKQEHATAISELKADHQQQMRDLKQDTNEQRTTELAELKRSYEQQLTLFKEQVTTATEKLLKERSGELQQANTQKMDELFKPIRENINRMERSMNENREASAKNVASFENTIKQMMASNARLGEEANRLSTALQRKNKTSGNWGELILSELLESQGLKPGVHFDVQQTMKDVDGRSILNEETGSRMIPDVILHLADNRDVVVDSKMSLTAYVDYQNADDELSKREALARHIESVRSHIKELSGKSYSDYIVKPHTSIDFVIMFVPIEGALQLALSEEPGLWHEAFQKKVFIAGGQTLIAALRIIDLTWVSVLQERNTEKIMDEARKLIDRVAAFYTEFLNVGKKLDDTAKAFGAVQKRVDEGSQSILATGRRLEALGARGKKELPGVGA